MRKLLPNLKIDLNGTFEGPYSSYISPFPTEGTAKWEIRHLNDSIFTDLGGGASIFESFKGKVVNDSTIRGVFLVKGNFGIPPNQNEEIKILDRGKGLYFNYTCCGNNVRYEVNLT